MSEDDEKSRRDRLRQLIEEKALRKLLEEKTGRSWAELLDELRRKGEGDPAAIARICSRLAGLKVPLNIVEIWLKETIRSDRMERWPQMVQRLNTVLNQVIDWEIERRMGGRSD